jgi:alcohol dehydrogenase
MAEFRVPPLVLTGFGCARELGAVLQGRGYRRAFLVSDPQVLALPAAQAVVTHLRQAGLNVAVHDGVTAEPTVAMVERALADLVQAGADVVIGLGGGSPMDTAKAVAVLACQPGPITRYEGTERIPGERLPLACVATTAGTGSEVTRYAAITDQDRHRKMLISSWRLLPDIAVADPELTIGLPPQPTVSTGIDALTHAIEAYVSRRAQPLTDPLALSAIRRIGRALPVAYRQPADRAARVEMSVAALEAGIAFCNASVALVHGMARPLGAYFGVPHGLANAVMLARVCAYSAAAAPERYRDVALALGQPVADASPADGAAAAVRAIDDLCAGLDVPSLRRLGVTRQALEAVVEQMAEDAIASGSPAHNPRPATAEEIAALYRACF